MRRCNVIFGSTSTLESLEPTFYLFFPFPFLFYSIIIAMKSSYNRKNSLERLDYYYQVINTTVLSKQNAASGLIPASVAITVSC